MIEVSLWPSPADPIQLQVLVVARGNAALLAMSKLARVGKKAPEGWDMIYDTLEMFDNRMKDAVNENHEGKRKNESNWFVPRRDGKACVQACVQVCVPAHRRGRTHRQTRDRQAGRQAGARVCCALPLFTRAGRPYQPRLTRRAAGRFTGSTTSAPGTCTSSTTRRRRFLANSSTSASAKRSASVSPVPASDAMLPTCAGGRVQTVNSAKLCALQLVDGNLMAKWKKPGYEFLCSVAAINKGSTNFGTTSVCRVPLRLRSGKIGPSQTGCISCASCDKGAPIWWNSTLPDAGSKRSAEPEVDEELERRAKALRGD